MKIAWTGINYIDRITQVHAWALACACVTILLLTFPVPQGGWAPFQPAVNESREREIDSALQEAATAALGQREGTIIVMDAQSGRIRALVNPKTAVAEAAMPGSTLKPFTALAALRAGLIDQDSRTVCPGRFNGRDFSLACVHADHLPPFTPSQAIAYSCNYYFATLGQRLGPEDLIKTLRGFGFGQLAAPGEVAGSLRPCETGTSARIQRAHHASAQSDCNARAAIGESDHIQVTPIQLLSAYAALVNGGHLFQPRVPTAEGFGTIERAKIEISARHRAVITDGMAGAVRYGTARQARLDTLPLYILGKTGTSIPPKGFRSNGWFVGFAAGPQPKGEPQPAEIELAVLVLVERSHGADAAALSRPVFEAYAAVRSRKSKTGTAAISSDDNSPARNPKPEIRVHLVTENLTQEQTVEEYVLGVMRAEGSMETEPEALKALAIAARTYALKNRGRHAKDGYDFCSTTHCQRFLPVRSSSISEGSVRDQALPNGRASDPMIAAVRATEGQVLLDSRGQLVDSYFGASCGGQTANEGTLWGVTPPEYLRGVRDEFCLSGPHAHWTDTITRADLLRALQSDSRTNVGNRLDQVVVSKRDQTGRAEFIAIEGEHRKSVRGWNFKIIVGRVLGWNLLKSSRFEVSRSGSNFIFRGSGFGHGLGLCQEGAHVLAARGTGYQRILEKYFPGTIVRKGGRAARSSGAEGADLNAKAAKLVAKSAEESLRVPLRNPLRPLRLDASCDHDPSMSWKADPFPAVIYEHSGPIALQPGQRFLAISSEHFRVTYPAGVDRRDANQVLGTLESARANFLSRAAAASISMGELPLLEIRLNDSTGDFTARTGQPWWAAAATKGNRIELQPVGILKNRGVLLTTLRHELAHAVIDRASHKRAPRWLEEGFAIYLAGEGQMISRYQRRGALSMEELEKRLERPGSQQDMQALYAQAYLNVNQLVRDRGEASVWNRIAAS